MKKAVEERKRGRKIEDSGDGHENSRRIDFGADIVAGGRFGGAAEA
jgi:hypothetical protein